jgi:chromosome segregation ATPase
MTCSELAFAKAVDEKRIQKLQEYSEMCKARLAELEPHISVMKQDMERRAALIKTNESFIKAPETGIKAHEDFIKVHEDAMKKQLQETEARVQSEFGQRYESCWCW